MWTQVKCSLGWCMGEWNINPTTDLSHLEDMWSWGFYISKPVSHWPLRTVGVNGDAVTVPAVGSHQLLAILQKELKTLEGQVHQLAKAIRVRNQQDLLPMMMKVEKRREGNGGEGESFQPIQVVSKGHTFKVMLPSQLEECWFRAMQLQQSSIIGDHE